MDGYHARTTHQRAEYLVATVSIQVKTRRRGGVGKSLGNGHAVIQSEPPWGRPIARWVPAFGEAKRGECRALQQELAERFGSRTGRIR